MDTDNSNFNVEETADETIVELKSAHESNQHDERQGDALAPEGVQTQEEMRVSELEAQVSKFKDQWMRTAAELENVRKRGTRERDDALKYGVVKFATDILAVSDNMQRALESAPQSISEDMKSLIEGLKLTQSELDNVFQRHHIRVIDPVGETFDPNFHQAMFEVPASEGMTPGTVAQVLQKGYMIHERLLRPALVGVIKGSSSAASDTQDQNAAGHISIDA